MTLSDVEQVLEHGRCWVHVVVIVRHAQVAPQLLLPITSQRAELFFRTADPHSKADTWLCDHLSKGWPVGFHIVDGISPSATERGCNGPRSALVDPKKQKRVALVTEDNCRWSTTQTQLCV